VIATVIGPEELKVDAPVADRRRMAGVGELLFPQPDCGRVAEHAGAIPY